MLSSTLFLAAIVAAVTAAPPHEGRIVDGTAAKLGEYPYVVSLQKNGKHSCGASILSEDKILTAAHCITAYEQDPTGLQIQYGVINIEGDENMIDVKRVIKKQDFASGNGYPNDVAILELSEKIKLGPNAQPVQLPSTDDYPGDNATAVLVGWGRPETNEPTTKDLMQAELILFTDSFCQSKEENYSPENHVCAGVPLGGRGQCNGDSGGPLTVNGVQYGIVSWSVKPCASYGHPGIYANVVAFRNWIRENSGI